MFIYAIFQIHTMSVYESYSTNKYCECMEFVQQICTVTVYGGYSMYTYCECVCRLFHVYVL